jgi:hypothetical protein
MIEDPGSFSGTFNSPMPLRGPEERNLMSFDILMRTEARELNVELRLTIGES